jgi:hypothetical protein
MSITSPSIHMFQQIFFQHINKFVGSVMHPIYIINDSKTGTSKSAQILDVLFCRQD